jgi:hypothetical protein
MQSETWYRLADRVGGTEGPYLDAEGAYIGPNIALFRTSASGIWIARPVDELRPILQLAYGAEFPVERSLAALQASAAALNAGEEAIAKIALLQARLPAIPAWSNQLLKYFFVPSEHPRWPEGDPDHHGGEFRPVGATEAGLAGPTAGRRHGDVPLSVAAKDDDEGVPPLGGQRRPKDEEVKPARILPRAPPVNPPPAASVSEVAGTGDAAGVGAAEAAGAVETEGAAAEEASLPLSEKVLRAQVRTQLNTFASEHPDLAQNLAEARRRFEAQYNVSESIRRSPEYRSYWQMPQSYEAARVSPDYYQFDTMQQFKDQFGDAPPGWQYHHLVNQNPANQANSNVNWQLHTTENVVLIPTWRHYLTFGPYNQTIIPGLTVRQWQAAQGYSDQLRYGLDLLWGPAR